VRGKKLFGLVGGEKKSNYKILSRGKMKTEMSYVNSICEMMTTGFVRVRP